MYTRRKNYKSSKGVKTYKKYAKKRTSYKKATVAPWINYFPALPVKGGNMAKTGVPPSMSVQLKSFDNIAVAPGASTQAYALKLTSTFDPLGDASAVQPIGRDQLAALYNSYLVNSGQIKLVFTNTGSAPVIIACYTSSQAVVAADINNYCGQPGAVYGTCAPTGSDSQCVLKRSFRSSQILGALDRSSHGAAVGADPTTIAYLYIYIKATTGNVTGHLTIEGVQNTVFYDKAAVVHA